MKMQEEFFRAVAGLPRLARGSLLRKGESKSGTCYYNLMYRKDTKLHSRHIVAGEVEFYREATDNYRKFMKAVDKYVEAMSKQAQQEIEKEAKNGKAGNRKASPS